MKLLAYREDGQEALVMFEDGNNHAYRCLFGEVDTYSWIDKPDEFIIPAWGWRITSRAYSSFGELKQYLAENAASFDAVPAK